MVEISSPGSGEGRGWATGPGYSTRRKGRISGPLNIVVELGDHSRVVISDKPSEE